MRTQAQPGVAPRIEKGRLAKLRALARGVVKRENFTSEGQLYGNSLPVGLQAGRETISSARPCRILAAGLGLAFFLWIVRSFLFLVSKLTLLAGLMTRLSGLVLLSTIGLITLLFRLIMFLRIHAG